MQDGPRPDKAIVNLAVDTELVERAKAAGVDLAWLLERALTHRLSESSPTAGEWRRDNAAAIAAWNEELERNGLWCDDLRTF